MIPLSMQMMTLIIKRAGAPHSAPLSRLCLGTDETCSLPEGDQVIRGGS